MITILLTMAATLPADDRLIVRADAFEGRPFDAPVSLSVLDEPVQSFLSPRAPAELLNRAPGTLVQSGSGREHLTALRSPVLTSGAGAGSFLFLQDGVPLRAPGFANVNGLFHAGFPFAEQVEVLRGPGDVGYGSNALHGAINVITPEPAGTGSTLTASVGSFDRARGILQSNNERAALGLSVLDDGGYRDDSGALELKAHTAVTIGEGTFRLALHHLEQETAGFVIGEDAFEDDALRRSNPNPEAFRDVRHGLMAFEQPFAVGSWTGTVTPFARWTDMEFLQHFLPGDALEENEHTSIGVQSLAFRNLGAGGELALGFDADLTEGSLREFQSEPTVFSFVQGLHYDYEVVARELAPFAKLSWPLSTRWQAEAGLRLTHTHYDYDNKTTADTVGRFQRPADRSDDFSVLTGKASLGYALETGGTLFLAGARGARPPQTTELYRLQTNQDVTDIEPETLDSIELGWRWAGAQSSLALTAFAMEKRNVFFRDADGFNVTDGETTHVGVEAEMGWAVADSLRLDASATYAEHRYAFDREVDNSSEVITDGDVIDTAPKTLASARLLWTPGEVWRLEAAATHVGSYPMNAAGTVTYDGHNLLDLRIGRDLGPAVTGTFIVRNALDERYARRADFAFGNERFFPGEERAVEFVLSAKF